MDLLITQILVYTLIALILIQFIKTVFSKDLTQVFSPMNVVSLCFIYYCLMPYFTGGSVNYSLGRQENVLFHACALISYICVQWGFSKPTGTHQILFSSRCFLQSIIRRDIWLGNSRGYGLWHTCSCYEFYSLPRANHK